MTSHILWMYMLTGIQPLPGTRFLGPLLSLSPPTHSSGIISNFTSSEKRSLTSEAGSDAPLGSPIPAMPTLGHPCLTGLWALGVGPGLSWSLLCPNTTQHRARPVPGPEKTFSKYLLNEWMNNCLKPCYCSLWSSISKKATTGRHASW